MDVYKRDVPDKLREKILLKYKNKCYDCNKEDLVMHVHHVKPLYKGGDNSEENLIVLCRKCHYSKHKEFQSFSRNKYKADSMCCVCKKGQYNFNINSRMISRKCNYCNYENIIKLKTYLEQSVNENYVKSCFKFLNYMDKYG